MNNKKTFEGVMKPFYNFIVILSIFVIHFYMQECGIKLYAQERGIKIVAKDTKGIPREVPLYNKSYAVIIGIDRYKNLDYNLQLKYAVSDAKGIKEVLSAKYMFDRFYELYNEQATKETILKTLQGELAYLTKDDALFVFYAGHGYTQTTQFGDEIGYIVPHDGSCYWALKALMKMCHL